MIVNLFSPGGAFDDIFLSNYATIQIKDNIIECNAANPRPLLRNPASDGAVMQNNTLVNITDTAAYANPDTGATRGPTAPLSFSCGVHSEYLVNGWTVVVPK